MISDYIKDKTYPGSEDEFEEISSVESTQRANELSPHQRSVHFILDERSEINNATIDCIIKYIIHMFYFFIVISYQRIFAPTK